MTTAEALLARQLDAIAAAIDHAWKFQNEHGLTTRHTRKPAADTLRSLRRWQAAVAADTVKHVVADGTAERAASADKPVNVVCKEPPTVSIAPTTSVRIPEPLRERVEQYGREHRWSMGEVTRVALEQLVGGQHDGARTYPGGTSPTGLAIHDPRGRTFSLRGPIEPSGGDDDGR
jgi:hypothetical protein